MKKISFLLLSVVGLSAQAGEVYNFGAKMIAEREIRENGTVTSPLGVSGTDGDFNGISVMRLFDGVTYRSSSSDGIESKDDRYMVSLYKHGVGNVYAQLAATDSFRPSKNFILKKYRIFRGSYWRQVGRDVTQWKIYGIPDGANANAESWVLLAEQNNDYVWPTYAASETNEFTVTATGEATVGFRAFRFVPTSSGYYQQSVTKGSAVNTYDLDLREIEFDVEEVDAPARAPMRIVDYLTERSTTAEPYYEAQNMYKSLDFYSSFDGLKTKGEEYTHRCLGYMGKDGGCYVGLNLTNATERLAGDTFYLKSYRVYTLWRDGNETNRVPTAWTMQTKLGENALAACDTQSGVNWGSVSFFGQNVNFLSFTIANAVPFDQIRFVPTDSWAWSGQNLTKASDINVGWQEIDLYISAANEKGTLRVKSSKFGGTGFTPEADTLVTAATTLTAPTSATVGTTSFAVTGHYLESFDFVTGRWQYKVGSYSESRSYTYTPDAEKAERLVWIVSDTITQANLSVADGACVGKETVIGLGDYNVGQSVTLTAVGGSDDLTATSTETNLHHSTFVRWEGDLEGLNVDPTSASITFAVDRARVLKPIFVRDWLLYTYDLANEGGSGSEYRIKDGLWEFKVNWDVNNNTVSVTTDGYRAGQGILDFNSGTIYRRGSTTQLVIKQFEPKAMGVYSGSTEDKRYRTTELILPESLEKLDDSVFRNHEKMVRLVANCPKLTEIPYCTFTRDTALQEVVLDVPNVQNLGQWAFFNVPLTKSSATAWNLSSVTNVGYQTFACEMGVSDKQVHYSAGILNLPALQSIDYGAFNNNKAFAELHLSVSNQTLTSIGRAVFNACAVTNLVLGTTRSLTVDATAFDNVNNSNGLRVVTFTSKAPTTRTAVDNILFNNDLTKAAKVATLNLPRAKQRSWEGYVTKVADITDATIKAAAEARAADGVWIAENGTYKAYVHYFGPHAPGTVVIVR